MLKVPPIAVIAVGALAFTGVYTLSSGEPSTPGPMQAQIANCVIKGNISLNSGERIYHLPGQSYYTETKISPEHGERWFCSEADARAAGWRRSKV